MKSSALAFILLAAQIAQPPILPQGWTAQMLVMGGDARLEHVSGGSLTVIRRRLDEEFDPFTHRTVEGVARPLGFARIGEPRYFRDSNQEWVEYDVRGNRLTARRRILYRAVRTNTDLFQIIYENSDERFEPLLSETLALASSLQSISRESIRGRERPRTQARRGAQAR